MSELKNQFSSIPIKHIIEHFYVPSTLFHIPDEAPFEPLSSSPETTTHLVTTKHQYIKQFELTMELLLISLTQLLEATAELVFFSHKFNPKLNIIALADVALGQVRQEANKIWSNLL